VLIARDITALGGYTFLFLLTGLLVLYFGLKHRPAPLLLLLATILGGTAINRVMKFFFARERPDIEWLVEVTSKSFPSGHAMLSAAVYLTLATLLAQRESRNSIKVFFLGSAMLLTFLVGTSRIYLGVHFPTDVLAGWIAGSVWAMICLLVAGHIRHRRQKTAPTTSRPSSG
jgi:undecaprenyl-diphosphatase